jgi:hypothetical protein
MGLGTLSVARRSDKCGFFPSLLLPSALSLASRTRFWVDLGTNNRKSRDRLAYP